MDMPRDQEPTFNQMKHVGTEERFERTCLELIGDFATYEPQGTTILVEGGSKFDQEMITRLFFTELRGVNVASIAGKKEVIKKKKELWKLQDIQDIKKEVITITDGDDTSETQRAKEEKEGEFRWDLYDIESYLLNAEYISQAVGQINLYSAREIPVGRVETLLQSCAREVMQELTNNQLVEYVRKKLRNEINQKVKRPQGTVTEDDLKQLVSGSKEAATSIHNTAQTITKEEKEKTPQRYGKQTTGKK